jgi:hydroxyacylglutathione hydrolase
MSALNVELIPAFQDNYIYLLRTPGSEDVGIVDAGDAVPALAELDRQGLTLTHIFNTHHHPDHIGGNDALKERFPNAKLVGPRHGRFRNDQLQDARGAGPYHRPYRAVQRDR